MATVNLLNATVIEPLTATYRCTASLADALVVPAGHCYLLKKIRAAAVDVVAYTVSVNITKAGGAGRIIAISLPVPAAGGVDIWTGSLPLDEGDKIQAIGSIADKVDLTFAGFDLA